MPMSCQDSSRAVHGSREPRSSLSTRLAVLLAVVASISGVACSSTSSTECPAIYVENTIEGRISAAAPFKDAKDFYVCYGTACGANLEGTLTVTADPQGEAFADGGTATDASTPRGGYSGKVVYRVPDRGVVQCKTGDVLRLRSPNRPEGPWTIDVSLVAEVVEETTCQPCHGSFRSSTP